MKSDITISLSKGLNAADASALEAELKKLPSVVSAQQVVSRGGPECLMLWAKLAASALAGAASALPFLQGLTGLIRGRNLGNVKIKFPTGGEIELSGNISAEDLEKLVKNVFGK